MNRLLLVRHGGSTGNEDSLFYAYYDSALCLTTNGIRQALSTAQALAQLEPRWLKPGDFSLEVYASEYTRAQQTARIVLDQMGLASLAPRIRADLNERDYGTVYDARSDSEAGFADNGSESAIHARLRVRGFLAEIEPILYRADVLAFSHMGTIRALTANLLHLSDDEMMKLDVRNGGVHLFQRAFGAEGQSTYTRQQLPPHVLPNPRRRSSRPKTHRRRSIERATVRGIRRRHVETLGSD